ncbi:hypothetical protein ACFPJ4_14675 [Lysinimonas soli]|uniref:Uncharacterized protein n=1 Tax=Lysinimonas soli TaxID=1074233 RepID=A0ABW0NSJ4_9MICO
MTFHPTRVVIGAAITAFSLAAVLAVAPPKQPDQLQAYMSMHAQKLSVSVTAEPTAVARDDYTATAGIESLVQSGTNYDWAKLVLLDGGFPITEGNVTVMTRWMRQENGAQDWWNRNNPLNNGLGSGGGGGTGTYPNLQVAAQYLAMNLRRPMFSSIAAQLEASTSTTATESAIWASGWATSHYANGAHWHYTPVDVVKAPASAWG